MSPFNSNNLVAPRNFNFETDVFEDGPFPGTIEVPDLSGVFNDYDVFGAGSYPVPDFVDYGVDFGTGGYIPEASNAYDFDFGGADRTGKGKTGTIKPGGINFTPGQGNNSFLEVLAANVGGLGADIATLFGGSSSGKGEEEGKGKKGADAIADYVKESTGILNDLTDETEAKTREYAAQVYPGLTGLTGEEALNKYYDAFSDTITRIEDRGLSQLGNRPDIGKEYDTLSGRVEGILNNNQYNLASQAGGYGNIARGEGVVQMDQGRLDAAGDRLLNAKYKQAYDYGDPQTSKFIYGSDNTANAIGKYYNTSGDVAGLMSYGAVG